MASDTVDIRIKPIDKQIKYQNTVEEDASSKLGQVNGNENKQIVEIVSKLLHQFLEDQYEEKKDRSDKLVQHLLHQQSELLSYILQDPETLKKIKERIGQEVQNLVKDIKDGDNGNPSKTSNVDVEDVENQIYTSLNTAVDKFKIQESSKHRSQQSSKKISQLQNVIDKTKSKNEQVKDAQKQYDDVSRNRESKEIFQKYKKEILQEIQKTQSNQDKNGSQGKISDVRPGIEPRETQVKQPNPKTPPQENKTSVFKKMVSGQIGKKSSILQKLMTGSIGKQILSFKKLSRTNRFNYIQKKTQRTLNNSGQFRQAKKGFLSRIKRGVDTKFRRNLPLSLRRSSLFRRSGKGKTEKLFGGLLNNSRFRKYRNRFRRGLYGKTKKKSKWMTLLSPLWILKGIFSFLTPGGLIFGGLKLLGSFLWGSVKMVGKVVFNLAVGIYKGFKAILGGIWKFMTKTTIGKAISTFIMGSGGFYIGYVFGLIWKKYISPFMDKINNIFLDENGNFNGIQTILSNLIPGFDLFVDVMNEGVESVKGFVDWIQTSLNLKWEDMSDTGKFLGDMIYSLLSDGDGNFNFYTIWDQIKKYVGEYINLTRGPIAAGARHMSGAHGIWKIVGFGINYLFNKFGGIFEDGDWGKRSVKIKESVVNAINKRYRPLDYANLTVIFNTDAKKKAAYGDMVSKILAEQSNLQDLVGVFNNTLTEKYLTSRGKTLLDYDRFVVRVFSSKLNKTGLDKLVDKEGYDKFMANKTASIQDQRKVIKNILDNRILGISQLLTSVTDKTEVGIKRIRDLTEKHMSGEVLQGYGEESVKAKKVRFFKEYDVTSYMDIFRDAGEFARSNPNKGMFVKYDEHGTRVLRLQGGVSKRDKKIVKTAEIKGVKEDFWDREMIIPISQENLKKLREAKEKVEREERKEFLEKNKKWLPLIQQFYDPRKLIVRSADKKKRWTLARSSDDEFKQLNIYAPIIQERIIKDLQFRSEQLKRDLTAEEAEIAIRSNLMIAEDMGMGKSFKSLTEEETVRFEQRWLERQKQNKQDLVEFQRQQQQMLEQFRIMNALIAYDKDRRSGRIRQFLTDEQIRKYGYMDASGHFQTFNPDTEYISYGQRYYKNTGSRQIISVLPYPPQ